MFTRKSKVRDHLGVSATYPRRCDECRKLYEHTKGANTGFCPDCEKAVRAYDLPPLHIASYTPLIEKFEAWTWP
jgi:hypothetical protein